MSEIIANKVKNDPNVVPLCDILLVLLIIFMVITPTLQKGLDVVLPETGGKGKETIIFLTMDRDLNLAINQQPVERSLLPSMLSSTYATILQKTIFVKPDRECAYTEVMKILDICKGAGIANICMVYQ